MKATKLELQNTNFFFLLIFCCNLFSPQAIEWRWSYQISWLRRKFYRSKTNLNDHVGRVQTLQLRGQDSATHTYAISPIQESPASSVPS